MLLGEVSAGLSIIEKLEKCANKNHLMARIKKQDYLFEKYQKEVTVYKNGNGIIITSFIVTVLKPAQFDIFKRSFNIEDAKKNIYLRKMSNLCTTALSDRFNKQGFWYYSENNIISDVEEKYWSDNPYEEEDLKSKNNPKEIKWIFKINTNKLEKNRSYKIIYLISMPGLYPLENGLFDKKTSPLEDENFSTSIHVEHLIKEIDYTISFENGIEIEEFPKCSVSISKPNIKYANKNIDGNFDTNIIFNKYKFKIKNPKFNSNIIINWKAKKPTMRNENANTSEENQVVEFSKN